jgi:hypothetical protein
MQTPALSGKDALFHYGLVFRYRAALIVAAVSLLGWFGVWTELKSDLAGYEYVSLVAEFDESGLACADLDEVAPEPCEIIYFANAETKRRLGYLCVDHCAKVIFHLEPGRIYEARVLRKV